MRILDKGLFIILGCSVRLILVAIPLALRRIPRNIAYGYRTRATMANDEIWLEANAHFGRGRSVAFLCGSFVASVISVLQPWSPAVFLPVSIRILVVPSLAAPVATWHSVRSLGASS